MDERENHLHQDSDSGPDNPISPESELRSIIADAAFRLGRAENAVDPLPALREVRGMLDEILATVDAMDGALLRASRRAEADHTASACVLASINRDIGKAFGLPGDNIHSEYLRRNRGDV